MTIVYAGTNTLTRTDLRKYLEAGLIDVDSMLDDHWNVVTAILNKWDIVDEDTLYDLPIHIHMTTVVAFPILD